MICVLVCDQVVEAQCFESWLCGVRVYTRWFESCRRNLCFDMQGAVAVVFTTLGWGRGDFIRLVHDLRLICSFFFRNILQPANLKTSNAQMVVDKDVQNNSLKSIWLKLAHSGKLCVNSVIVQ